MGSEMCIRDRADDDLRLSDEEIDNLRELFNSASNFVRSSSDNFNQDQLLYLYSRFKQVSDPHGF